MPFQGFFMLLFFPHSVCGKNDFGLHEMEEMRYFRPHPLHV